MSHYICFGECKGYSEEPGTCQGEGCSKQGQPLMKCDCEDGQHEGAFSDMETEKTESE